ncbi:MAG: hypothetical protein AAF304_00895 [Pseudomonadota bacterium]
MPEFMMIMKEPGKKSDWRTYINELKETGTFRGGSALGNGICVSKQDNKHNCTVIGFMRFEADKLNQVRNLIAGNPHYESGGEIEIHELIEE